MDLDGTAVCDDYSLGAASKAAILRAKDAGHIVAFASGRRDVDMLSLNEDEVWCVDYQLLNTGGKIIRCSDRAVIKNHLIPPDACQRFINYCFENDLQFHVCDAMTWQVNKMSEGVLEYANDLGLMPEIVTSIDQIKWENGIEGFMASMDWEPIAKFIDEHVPEMYYVNSEPGVIDIMPAGATKWGCIAELAEILGIPNEDIIAVGNYYNDMDMIEHAGVGIAVANSLEPVKEIADFVTERDNNHDAVEEIVEKMLRGDYDV